MDTMNPNISTMDVKPMLKEKYAGKKDVLRLKKSALKAIIRGNKKVNKKELKKGIRTEKEHTNNPRVSEKIARDHLAEDKKYYTKLKKAGL